MKKINYEEYAIARPKMDNIPSFRKQLLNKCIKPEMRILDVGCGDGIHMLYLSNKLYVPKSNIQGTEISAIRVDRVRHKGFKCIKVEGHILPFPNNSFDACIIFEVIEHIHKKDSSLFIKEIRRVLKSNGVLIGTTPNYPIKRYYDFYRGICSMLKAVYGREKKIFKNMEYSNIQQDNQKRNDCIQHHFKIRSNYQNMSMLWQIFEKLRNRFLDDPTHVDRYNFNRIFELGDNLFKEIGLYTTFGNKAQRIELLDLKKYLSHKIGFIYRK